MGVADVIITDLNSRPVTEIPPTALQTPGITQPHGTPSGSDSATRTLARPAFDAARLKTGRFVYRTRLDGADAGTATISVTRVDAQTYRFGNEVEFDPWTGISPVSASIGEPEQVRVPAGTFAVLRVVYRIEKKARGLEQYEIWVTQSVPRFLVREDFPNGARSELVRVAE